MHLLALGAFWLQRWSRSRERGARKVLMHLLALGAFWRTVPTLTYFYAPRLNAPFGARCFLTKESNGPQRVLPSSVIMHLLALGAF